MRLIQSFVGGHEGPEPMCGGRTVGRCHMGDIFKTIFFSHMAVLMLLLLTVPLFLPFSSSLFPLLPLKCLPNFGEMKFSRIYLRYSMDGGNPFLAYWAVGYHYQMILYTNKLFLFLGAICYVFKIIII